MQVKKADLERFAIGEVRRGFANPKLAMLLMVLDATGFCAVFWRSIVPADPCILLLTICKQDPAGLHDPTIELGRSRWLISSVYRMICDWRTA